MTSPIRYPKNLLTMARWLLIAAITIVIKPAFAELRSAQTDNLLTFTAPQAEAGKKAYAAHCSNCHGKVLEGSGPFPALTDAFFNDKWGGKPAATLAAKIRTMPPGRAGKSAGIDDTTYADLMAFILRSNGFAAGSTPLPSAIHSLASLTIPKTLVDTHALHIANASADRKKALLKRRSPPPATAENPAEDDWPHWGRTYDGLGFSPLQYINTANVDQLTLAWKLPLYPAPAHSVPLVHQGLMYLHVFPDSVLALDATDGSILWRYRHTSTVSATGKMGIAINGHRLFMPTSDMKLLAIDRHSGELLWEQAIATDSKTLNSFTDSHYLRAAPVAVGNVVIQGVAGPLMNRGNFIVGLDSNSGSELWRFNTIPHTGEAGNNSWNGIPSADRSGASVWQYGTYDAKLNLVYFGVSQTYDTAPLLTPVKKPGTTNEGLYTNTTVALNPDTGKLVWHYQHIAAGQWDMDWAFERQIVELSYRGKPHKAVITIGKLGILDALDAASGEYLFSVDLGIQNYVTAIDPVTGKKKVDPGKLPHPAINTIGCPHLSGVRNWATTAYNPVLGRLYIPSYDSCAQITIGAGSNLTSGLYFEQIASPHVAKDSLGQLFAVDLNKQRVIWSRRHRAPVATGLLTTAGNLVFAGDVAPSVKAYHAETGALLWQAPLDQAPSAGLMTYAVDGQQYIAISVGLINNLTKLKADFFNEQTGSNTLVGTEGAALRVFALQQSSK